ncbi:PREDICTED: uncharacterized protein LOC107100092 [Cyprinodon variegatus]|uniref:Uncharacterized LOC107100092 n=1 Tax=Cyprinodon variegatus TaxID=28743 RepID=A0A3Q2CRJ2_CYPVA|nr:PREDICTED: uncharacterized protein LOC107100092 [Cyprinodon variegatus]
MDDLDHSIHIAENDWSSFYDDSEECNLLQASLAYPDDSDLSDSEDSGNFHTGQQNTNKSANSHEAEESYTDGTHLPPQPIQCDATSLKPVELCVGCPERNAISIEPAHKDIAQEILHEKNDSSTNMLEKNPQITCNSEEMLSKDGAVQMTSNFKATKTPDLLSQKESVQSMSKPDPTGRAEKERWFVTVNDNMARRRGRSISEKKKLKQKRHAERTYVHNAGRKLEQKQSRYFRLNKNKESEDSDKSYDSFSSLGSSQLQDGAELSSTGSWDSETYLSAAESVEEDAHPLQEGLSTHLPLQCALSPTCDNLDFCQTLSYNAPNCGDDITPESLSTSSCAEMPDGNFISGNDTCSETPPLALASADSKEDYLSHLPAHDLTRTPSCTPETFAKATGQAQPVYAISAFWDEVEKLTINDILQIRMGRNSGIKEESVMPSTCGQPANPGQLIENLDPIIDTSDTADSDYFTQPDESKPDRSVLEFSASDFEEGSWQFVNGSRNSTPDLRNKTQQIDSSVLLYEQDNTDSEGRETPAVLDQRLDYQDYQGLISWPKRMTKSRSLYNIQTLNTEDLPLLPSNSIDKSDFSLDRPQIVNALLPHTDPRDYRTSFPEIFEYFFTKHDTQSQILLVDDLQEMFVSPVFHSPLCIFREDPLQCNIEKIIPIFSCSRPTVRDLTFQNTHVFLSTDHEEENKASPMRLLSHSFIQANPHRASGAAGAGGSPCWKSFLSFRKIRFPDKGSICCSESGAWTFPLQTKEIQIGSQNQVVTLLSDEKVCLESSPEFRELKEEQMITETSYWMTKRGGIFSRVKQSDLCLVCIAFASWVMRSSNPKEADAWKAALLANVSALSAIQYLRQYMQRKNLSIDDI